MACSGLRAGLASQEPCWSQSEASDFRRPAPRKLLLMVAHATQPIPDRRPGDREAGRANAPRHSPMTNDVRADPLARGQGAPGLPILAVHPARPASLNTYDPAMPGRDAGVKKIADPKAGEV